MTGHGALGVRAGPARDVGEEIGEVTDTGMWIRGEAWE